MTLYWQIWAGPLSGKRVVILFVNRKPWKSTMTAHWDDIGITSNNVIVKARDLWVVNHCLVYLSVHNL